MLLQSIVGRVGRDQIAEDIGRRLHFVCSSTLLIVQIGILGASIFWV
jgi:hypothetical protein